jgi:cellulase/cellobiase CelA1
MLVYPEFPDVRVIASNYFYFAVIHRSKIFPVIEPDSLANLVTNLSVAKCANAQTTYLVCHFFRDL